MVFSSMTSSVFANQTITGRVDIADIKGQPTDDFSGVVVFVDGASVALSKQTEPPKISHKNSQFSPHILPVSIGDEVDFLNDDNIYHNAFSLSKTKPFDLGIYPTGTSKKITFSKAGLVKLYCHLHPNMVSNILVLNNRLFAVTNEQGFFKIDNVPLGTYELRAWHELSEELSQTVTIKPKQDITTNFRLVATKKRLQHKNKFGKPYRDKY